ncbi:VPS13B [Symbiodinium sp. CCMP2592]|nr:VPS13B [Symbiodinium sp. CCMP2592]
MLEAVLTRIILRYAQRYICDTLRTDSLSLWGGDLRVANFELRTEELARVLGTEESSIQLTRGFVRELRVVVPWNAIRSQSLRVEVDAVEIIFGSCSGGQPTAPPAASPVAPAKESSQDALDESQETWLQPLLRNIFGNVTVSIDNLVAKLERNGAVACVTVERLDSRPHSATWEAGFTPLPSLQPTLFRVVSARDVTVTLDHLQQAPLPPTGRVGFYLSPVRARLAGDQVQILAQLLSPEVPVRPGSGGWSEGEADSESDRFSLLSGRETVQSHPSVSSRTRSSSGVPVEGKQPKVGRQATPDRPGSETSSAPATPSRAAGPAPSKASLLHGTSAKSLPEDETLQEETSPVEGPREERRGGLRNFLSDVLFGDDDDEEEDVEERADADAEGSRAAQRETRRVVCCSGAAPLLALTLESASAAAEQSAHSQSSVIGTFALIGISAMAVSPAAGDEPLEGSFETHHIAIFAPLAALQA